MFLILDYHDGQNDYQDGQNDYHNGKNGNKTGKDSQNVQKLICLMSGYLEGYSSGWLVALKNKNN